MTSSLGLTSSNNLLFLQVTEAFDLSSAEHPDGLKLREEDKNIFDYCRENNIDYVTKAIQSKKVDVNVTDEEGRALLHWACDRGHKELVSVLLQHAADVNIQGYEEFGVSISTVLTEDQRPQAVSTHLCPSQWHGDASMQPTTLAASWQVQTPCGSNLSVRHLEDRPNDSLAVDSGEGPKRIHNRHQNLHLNPKDDAATCEFLDIVELLLQSGADPGLRDQEGCLPEEVTDSKAITSALQQHVTGEP
ncbi:hypothetical protein BTVI_120891 [Pitangus sulphuratus]|nr:hypothetical protein BTVI_120891 [Pitangus sulphuratus]